VEGFPLRKVHDLKERGIQRDLKKIFEACSKATVNCPGLIGTVQEDEFTAQKRAFTVKNARLLPEPLGKALKFETTIQNRSALSKNARLAIGTTDQYWAVNSQI
jgi:hypothetical protein